MRCPSRSSIITGRYPHNTDAEELHWPLPASQVTFVERLKAGATGPPRPGSGTWAMPSRIDSTWSVRGTRPISSFPPAPGSPGPSWRLDAKRGRRQRLRSVGVDLARSAARQAVLPLVRRVRPTSRLSAGARHPAPSTRRGCGSTVLASMSPKSARIWLSTTTRSAASTDSWGGHGRVGSPGGERRDADPVPQR